MGLRGVSFLVELTSNARACRLAHGKPQNGASLEQPQISSLIRPCVDKSLVKVRGREVGLQALCITKQILGAFEHFRLLDFELVYRVLNEINEGASEVLKWERDPMLPSIRIGATRVGEVHW